VRKYSLTFAYRDPVECFEGGVLWERLKQNVHGDFSIVLLLLGQHPEYLVHKLSQLLLTLFPHRLIAQILQLRLVDEHRIPPPIRGESYDCPHIPFDC